MGRKPIWSGLVGVDIRRGSLSQSHRKSGPDPSTEERKGVLLERPEPRKLISLLGTLFPILAFLVFPLLSANAARSATHIQQASASNVGGGTLGSFSATFAQPTTTGNAIILGVTFGNVNPTITVTDSQGNIYAQAIKTYDSGHRQGSAILYATNITGGSRNTVTVKFSTPVAYLAVGIHEYSGIAAASALDASLGKVGSGSTPSSGSAVTTANADLIFGCGVEDSSGSGDTFTAGTGFAKRVDLGATAAFADEDSLQTNAGPIAATWTLSPANGWIAAVSAFKTTGGSQNPTAPSITGLSPASGLAGASVTITGKNFGQTQGTSTVRFNGTAATATSWSASSVVTTVPSAATTGNVSITVGGLTSNGVPFTVQQLAVTVSPGSATLQVGQSAGFTANVQNDSQSKGVSWTLAGGGCSGASCGTLTNVTSTSATYAAPSAVPTPSSVTLKATSVADASKSASATITLVTAPTISVSVNPPSPSVPVSSSTVLTASVANDPQNKGVTWSLAGSGCSGAACGSLSNSTTSSVTYTAPATAPSQPKVMASSITDTTKTGTSSITVTGGTAGGSTPTFAENHVSGSNTQGNTVNSYILRLPNASLAGNCIIVGFQYGDIAGVTPSVTDDKGNTYSSPMQNSDGRQVVNLSYALNVVAGAQKITITFSGTNPPYVSAMASEFYNVVPSAALDGHSANSGVGSSVSAGSFTPAGSGDLIYQYAVQDTTTDAPMTAWTQGANPWALLSADLLDGSAAQYQVQTSASAITPTLGMAPAQNFNSVAIALKSGSAGTPPPAGIRVVRVQHNSLQAYANSPVHLQFPSTGNLLVVSWIGVPGHDVTGVTDGHNNAYVSTGPAFGYGLSGDSQIYYAANANTGTTMVGPNLSTAGTDISGSTAELLDVRGAASAPYDTGAGLATASGNQTSSGNVTAVTLSPTTAKGLVVSSIGIDSNTLNGVSPGNFLSVVPSPVTSPNRVDQNNGWAVFYNPTAGPSTFVWTSQDGPVYNWASIAVAFKAAP